MQGVCHISTLLYGSASMFPRLQFSSGEKTGEPKATSSTLVARTRKNFPDRFVLPTDKSLSKHALRFFLDFSNSPLKNECPAPRWYWKYAD